LSRRRCSVFPGSLPVTKEKPLLALWREFEAGESVDARFAKAFDRAQPLIANVAMRWHLAENGATLENVLQQASDAQKWEEQLDMSRILYSGTKNASSWAFRAWLALKEQNIDFDERVVDIRKPQRFANLAHIGEFSPPGAVPVLIDGESVIYDSLAIMEYANELGDGSLLPADIKLRAQTRSLVAWQHSGLSNLCPRLSFESSFYPDKRAMSAHEEADAQRLFGVFETLLRRSDGPYLVGTLSLADLAFVPTLIRIMSHGPSLDMWPMTEAWYKLLTSRESVQEWMQEARSLPPVLLDDYTN